MHVAYVHDGDARSRVSPLTHMCGKPKGGVSLGLELGIRYAGAAARASSCESARRGVRIEHASQAASSRVASSRVELRQLEAACATYE